jgi:hypothetical protein
MFMNRNLRATIGLAAGCWLVSASASTTSAGLFCKKDASGGHACCQPEPPKEKKHCKDAPRGPIAFPIGGIVREGSALDVDDESIREALEESVAKKRQVKDEAAGQLEPTTIQRVERLERDVADLKSMMLRLTVAVEKLADAPAGKTE